LTRQSSQPGDGFGNGDDPSLDYKPEAVEESVSEAKFHAEFEGSRLDALRQRSGWLLAFDGVIISLIASQTHEMLDKTSLLGSVGRWIAAGALASGALFVLASVGYALAAVFRA
jgi:hypothetical protein